MPRSTRLPCVVLWHEQLGLPPLRSPSVNMAKRGWPRDGKPPSTGQPGQLALMHRPSRPQPVRGALLLDGNRPSSSNSRTDQPSGDEPPWKRSRVEIRGSVASQVNRNTRAARRAALLGPADDPATFLKQRTVTATTRILYLDCVDSFCKEMGVRANELSVNFTPYEIDQLLERYLGTLYSAGDGIAAARWALYALAWFLVLPIKSPTILPRAKMTLKGFARQDPDLARDPGPWEAACLIAEHLAFKFGYEGILAAAATLLQFDLYTRPSETLNIEFQHVLPPERGANPDYSRWAVIICPSTEYARTKTGTQDDTITCGTDVPERAWLVNVLAALHRSAAHDGKKLIPISLNKYETLTRTAARELNLNALKLSPHSWRHGGPSTDFLLAHRTRAQIQPRGRWRCPASVARYEKHGKLLRQLSRMTIDQKRKGLAAATVLSNDLVVLINAWA